MATSATVSPISRGNDNGSSSISNSCFGNASRCFPNPRKPAFFHCQAQQSCDRSMTMDKQSSLYNVADIQQRNLFFQNEGLYARNDVVELSELVNNRLLLRVTEDVYDGVIIDPQSLPKNSDDFLASLRASLLLWKMQRKKGVWLQLPTEFAEYVPLAIKEGFQYHHAEPSYVMMTYWIPDKPCTLPPNASHQVGIGAFVINGKREVLAVQEKTGPLRGSGVWKLPTGLINEGEDLCAGAVREVKEETGVDTEFLQVVAFRHGHFVSFSKSDLYFMCSLKPLSQDIKLQDGEIEAATWIPLEEFQSQAFYAENETRRKMLELCVASVDGTYKGFKAEELLSSSLAQPTQYFFNL